MKAKEFASANGINAKRPLFKTRNIEVTVKDDGAPKVFWFNPSPSPDELLTFAVWIFDTFESEAPKALPKPKVIKKDTDAQELIKALEKYNGNRTYAANYLGISTKALRNKIRILKAKGIKVPPANAGNPRNKSECDDDEDED